MRKQMRHAVSGELRWLAAQFKTEYQKGGSYVCPVCAGPIILSSAGDHCPSCKSTFYLMHDGMYRDAMVPEGWLQPWVDTPRGRFRVVVCPECGGHPCVDADEVIQPHCRPVLISQEHPEWGYGADWCPAQGTKAA